MQNPLYGKHTVVGVYFWDLDKYTPVPLKLFSGLFLNGQFERRIDKLGYHNDAGFDVSTEFGVEIEIFERKKSVYNKCHLFTQYLWS